MITLRVTTNFNLIKPVKAQVQNLTEFFMKALHQNRIIITFSDEIRMLEMNDETDPRIHIEG
jgi:hypothetical protein